MFSLHAIDQEAGYLRIYLDDEDCPNAGDRDVAARIVEEIVLNDVVTKGSAIAPPGGSRRHSQRHVPTNDV